MASAQPLWTPDPGRVARARITQFMQAVRERWQLDVRTYEQLYAFSIERPLDFWATVWDFCGIIGARGERVAIDMDRMPGAQFFPDARLNFAENVLRQRGSGAALVFNGENQRRRTVSHDELRTEVARFAAALRAAGITPGDRVGGYIANLPEAIIAALGAAAVGAVWSSCSPDFGVQGVLDRFGQIEPRILIVCDGYFYGGKTHEILSKVAPSPTGCRRWRKWLSYRTCTIVLTWRTPEAQCCGPSSQVTRTRRRISSRFRSTTRSTSSTPRAPPVSRNASFMVTAARSSST